MTVPVELARDSSTPGCRWARASASEAPKVVESLLCVRLTSSRVHFFGGCDGLIEDSCSHLSMDTLWNRQ